MRINYLFQITLRLAPYPQTVEIYVYVCVCMYIKYMEMPCAFCIVSGANDRDREGESAIQLCKMVLGLKKLRQIAFIVLIISKAKFAR